MGIGKEFFGIRVKASTATDLLASSEVVVVAADKIILGDASDGFASKTDTVQGILDLVGADTKTLTNTTFDANGSGNTISNIDVADLATGTDGELITWDSSGNPDTVAVGSSGEVLTSNGAGSAPTFQSSSSAPTTFGSVGTYLLAIFNGGGNLASGATTAGSNLDPVSWDNGDTSEKLSGSAPSGTWRNMGAEAQAVDNNCTLWVRTV